MSKSELSKKMDETDAKVRRAAAEALAGTGVELLVMAGYADRAMGISEVRDAFEIRFAYRDAWTRIVSRQEIGGGALDMDDASLIAEVNAACNSARADIALRCTTIAKAATR